jgi:hypothetical protein
MVGELGLEEATPRSSDSDAHDLTGETAAEITARLSGLTSDAVVVESHPDHQYGTTTGREDRASDAVAAMKARRRVLWGPARRGT